MKRFVLAVSGGVDSVVLMWMFDWPDNTVVAHFDHGIRPSSAEDCAFVEKLAKQRNWKFVSERTNLGQSCSEARARQRRYEFLFRVAEEHQAELVTAHHADDCIETIAINLLRGTGWRGLAPLSDVRILRPLLQIDKADIYRFASEHQLRFRLDQSNNELQYLRNRLRRALSDLSPNDKQRLLALYHAQLALKTDIDTLLTGLVGTTKTLPRRYLTDPSDPAQVELLRFFLARQDCPLTRPQAERCLCEIVKFTPGKKYSLNRHSFLQADRQNYRLVTK